MAKYKAAPFYDIEKPIINDEGNVVDVVRIKFDFFGEYETGDAEEVEILNGLCPQWVVCIDPTGAISKKPKPKTEETEAPAKPARKPSAK